jgi:hypothetical protein
MPRSERTWGAFFVWVGEPRRQMRATFSHHAATTGKGNDYDEECSVRLRDQIYDERGYARNVAGQEDNRITR